MSVPAQLPLLQAVSARIALDFTLADIRKLQSESDALAFSVRVAGYQAKDIPLAFGIDAGQWSNILTGTKHFPQNRRNEFMDFVGNEALLMYGVESRGYDWSTLRQHQSDLERENERLRQENAQLRHDREVEKTYVAHLMGKAER